MSRLPSTTLGPNEAYADQHQGPMIDLSQPNSGSMGFVPNYSGHVSYATYVRRNLIAVLITPPRGFQYLPNADRWIATLKNLIETQAQSIEGLRSTLEISHSETPVGGAGEIQQDVTDVKRPRSTPTFTWVERYGKPINAFLEGWVVGLLMDPETKTPTVLTQNNADDQLPDMTGATVLFFEPDNLQKNVLHAWLCTNMHPENDAGEVEGVRNITAEGETSEYSVPFTALTQQGKGVKQLAQRILDDMTLSGVNPNARSAFVDSIDARVQSADTGFARQVEDVANATV